MQAIQTSISQAHLYCDLALISAGNFPKKIEKLHYCEPIHCHFDFLTMTTILAKGRMHWFAQDITIVTAGFDFYADAIYCFIIGCIYQILTLLTFVHRFHKDR